MRATLVLAIVLLSGCGGYRQGDVYNIVSSGRIYLDEKTFEEARQRDEAGVSMGIEELMKLSSDNKIAVLGNGSQVKIVESVKGGAKVAVLNGDDSGKLGWMLARELPDVAKKTSE